MTKKRKEISIPNYSLSEELINSISHGIAAGLSIWGLVMLIIKASHVGALAVTTVTIFGTTMVLLYTISCIYHALSSKVRGKKVLRVLDHCNVFLLVFGTIIPVVLLGIGGAKGWICFGIVAFVTIIGIISSAVCIEKVQIFEVVCHLLNGWSMLIYIKILLNNIGSTGVGLIVLGGIMYSIGAILYGLGSRKRYAHSVFHFFCILGTFAHYFAIYLYVL